MKQSIFVSLTVLAGILIWTGGELIIFGSPMNENESALVGFCYFLFMLFVTGSLAGDVAHFYRPRHATKITQDLDLYSLVTDDLFVATTSRLID